MIQWWTLRILLATRNRKPDWQASTKRTSFFSTKCDSRVGARGQQWHEGPRFSLRTEYYLKGLLHFNILLSPTHKTVRAYQTSSPYISLAKTTSYVNPRPTTGKAEWHSDHDSSLGSVIKEEWRVTAWQASSRVYSSFVKSQVSIRHPKGAIHVVSSALERELQLSCRIGSHPCTEEVVELTDMHTMA